MLMYSLPAANQSTGMTQDSITDYVQGTDKFAVTIDNSTASGLLWWVQLYKPRKLERRPSNQICQALASVLRHHK